MSEEIAGPNFEIRRKNFQGLLPIQVTVDDSDNYSDKEIPTYYVMQPRMSYLFLLTPQISDFYAEYLDIYAPNKDDFWFSYKSEPLRFDIPIGILYDTLVEKSGDKSDPTAGGTNLPFKITLQYKNFPTKTLQKGMIRHIFPQALKESAMMRTGKASAVQDKLEHVKSMLNAIRDGKYDDFWRYNEELGEHSLSQLKYFPVRVVINKNYHPFMSAKDKASDDAKTKMMVIQRPIAANNKDMWVGEYLARVLPKYFHIQTEITVDEDEEENKEEDKKESHDEVDYVEKTRKGTEVIINGLNIDLDISLTWLVLNLTALDNFLYITVRVPRKSSDDQ